VSGAELLAEKFELFLLLGELLRLFAHQLAQFFDLFTIVRRGLAASDLAVSDLAAGVLAFLSVAAAGEFLAAASLCLNRRRAAARRPRARR